MTVYVEARPKGRPEGTPMTIMSSKSMRTTCSLLSRRIEKPSIGQKVWDLLLPNAICRIRPPE
jgi:hypothetical protein